MFTLRNIYPGGNRPYHPCMLKTIEDIRLDNLKKLLEPRGAARRIAHALGKEPNYISQVKTGKKGFSSDMARAIEEAEGLDPGWMDNIHTNSDHEEFSIEANSIEELAEQLRAMKSEEVAELFYMVMHGKEKGE